MAVYYHNPDGTVDVVYGAGEDEDNVKVVVNINVGDDDTHSIAFENGIKQLEDEGIYKNVTGSEFDLNNLDRLNLTGQSQDIKNIIDETPTTPTNLPDDSLIGAILNKNLLLEKQNKLKALEIKSNAENTKVLLASNLSISNDLKSLAHIINVGGIANDNNMILKSELIGATIDNTIATEKVATETKGVATETKGVATETKNKTSTVNMGNISMNNESLVEATNLQTEQLTKIAKTSEAKLEHLEFEKNGIDALKDSKGANIKPREVKALNNAENHILKKDINTFDHKKNVLDVLGDFDLNYKDEEDSSLATQLAEILNVDKSVFDIEDTEMLKFERSKNV